MATTDDPGAEPPIPLLTDSLARSRVDIQLVEALVHLLIEKGVLTRNDALGIIQTVAQVKQGEAVESRDGGALARAELHLLERLFTSFEAISERPGQALAEGGNIRQLRPSLHRDRPEFPQDD